MKYRVAASALVLAAVLAGCSNEADPQPSATATAPVEATATPADSPTPGATIVASGEIRPIVAGNELASTANALRSGFPTWEPLTDGEIEIALNAGCDGLDATGTPEGGADAIKALGLDAADAAFGLLAAISNYCPEYVTFLGGSSN